MKKIILVLGLVVVIGVAVFFAAGYLNKSTLTPNTSWEDAFSKKAGEKVILEGFLRDNTVQYPTDIFLQTEKYNYLSSNNGYPIEGQIPLIVSDLIDCPKENKAQVAGTVVLRKGPGGMGFRDEGFTDYHLIKVDNWNCQK